MSDPQRLQTASVFHGDPERIALPDPTLTNELLAFVRDQYGPQPASPIDLGGSFNLNVRLGDRVLRVYGPWVDPERLTELQQIRRTLIQRGVPIPQLVPALGGQMWCRFGDSVLEVEHYVSGSPMTGPQRLRSGMVQFGRLHDRLADLDIACPPPLANHLPQERAVDATNAATTYVRANDPTPVEERYCQVAEELAELLPVRDLPTQLVHGDYWDNNVLFRDHRVAAVLDFDFAGVRPRIDDLAIPLGYLMHAGHQPSQIRELLDVYDSGTEHPLSRDEREALPYAMARAALFFLQYLLIPADEPYKRHARQEFRDKRGPACQWWLDALSSTAVSAESFRQ